MRRAASILVLLTATMAGVACRKAEPMAASTPERLTAQIIDSGFADAHDTYNAISCASDGRIYYVLSSDKADVAARMFSYDPASGMVRSLGDLNEAAGEKGA